MISGLVMGGDARGEWGGRKLSMAACAAASMSGLGHKRRRVGQWGSNLIAARAATKI